MLVLDEADEMLNKGFKEQIYDVYRYLPPATQVCLISATLPHEILEMTSKFMSDPIRILVKRDELTLEGIKQFFVAVELVSSGSPKIALCASGENTKNKSSDLFRPRFVAIRINRPSTGSDVANASRIDFISGS